MSTPSFYTVATLRLGLGFVCSFTLAGNPFGLQIPYLKVRQRTNFKYASAPMNLWGDLNGVRHRLVSRSRLSHGRSTVCPAT